MTDLADSCSKVLFFANIHFIFFNFQPIVQNTLSFFLPTHKANRQKNERVFSPPLYSMI